MQDPPHSQPAYIRELLALMPLSARKVLICDGGSLLRDYRARNPGAHITAIGACEPNCADRIVDGKLDNLNTSELRGPFDLVVINETLGWSVDPARVLRRLVARLEPGGHLITSFRNDSYFERMRMRLQGRSVPRDALAPETVRDLLTDAGLVMRRMRRRMPSLHKDAVPFHGRLLDLGVESGLARSDLEARLGATHFVAVATRPVGDEKIPDATRFHLAELARGLDIRTTVPAAALSAEPALQVTQAFRKLETTNFGSAGGVLLVQRPRLSEPHWILNYVAHCQKNGIVVIVEYDDDPSLVARILVREDVPEIYHRNLSLAHAVQTSTPVLAQQFSRSNPEVMIFPNVAVDLPPVREHRAGPLRILFGALNRSRTAEMAALFAPAIAALPEAVFEVVHDREFFEALPTTNKKLHKLLPYRDYLNLLGSCDICLMPLEGLPEELGKSDLKWVEAASRGAIALASPAVYEGTIRHGENGFIVREPSDWSRVLIELAADAGLRQQIAQTAWAEVRAGRMMSDQVALRRDWYLDLMSRREELFAAAIRRSPALAAAMAAG